jgi:hypothetical protein
VCLLQVGSPPVWRGRLLRCPHITAPWLSHTRDALMAQRYRHAPRQYAVSSAFSITNHGYEAVKGWGGWRRELRDACGRLKRHMPHVCKHAYQSITGTAVKSALELYAQSTFCLMPPGDSVVRGAILDALSVACVPVFFHSAQRTLWAQHWNASAASVLIDWSVVPASERNGTAALLQLVDMATWRPHETQMLRDAAASAHERLTYRADRGTSAAHDRAPLGSRDEKPDALDLLVEALERKLATASSTEDSLSGSGGGA